jgi:hypothetical protein
MSETYVKSEIESIRDDYDVFVIGLGKADLPYKNTANYSVLSDWDQIAERIDEFRPHVLHTHWLYEIWHVEYFAKKLNIPYTVRAHSFDVLIDPENHYAKAVSLINNDLCLGVLTFPFGRRPLENIGVHSDKLHDCFPVVNYKRFYDRSQNGDAIMNVGGFLPKKSVEDYIELATKTSQLEFNLYALGTGVDKFKALNNERGCPVNLISPIELEEMPAEYKRHRWLVYTASRKIGTVGWPMAIAEAQASGVGVCIANLRPDLRDYVGDAGFLFNSMSEVVDIISKPFPEEMRERGFEQAKKSDVHEHKTILTNLWQKAYT